MSDGFTEKVKGFFGFGEVDSYEDPYYRDEFDEDDRRGAGGPVDDERAAASGDYRRGDRSSRYADLDGGRDGRDARPRDTRARDYDYRDSRDSRAGRLGEPAAPAAAPSAREPQVVRLALSSFQQAGELATEFRAGDIVVINLSGMEKAEASRVLDFSVGLAKGLDGTLKKLGGLRNFALIPASVTLDQSQLDQLVEDQ
ncbi:MAG TPA: cell division protein SepF [Candidatus Corynebacterium avicola]|uniref:Cell division protein SepF n=1 Tax=Candidatus Corynebacterium avicola TaxID=2838527 RepID=A0A9D1RPV6_9CORY|nr:cell division protein SepF [Candidatus Corynebacterium avicola]